MSILKGKKDNNMKEQDKQLSAKEINKLAIEFIKKNNVKTIGAERNAKKK